jgi:hypothetical protein
LPVTFDPSPIIDEGPLLDPKFLSDWDHWCGLWLESIGARNIKPSIPTSWIDALVNGPNGPALATSHYDAVAVMEDAILLEHLTQLAQLTGRDIILDQMKAVASHSQGGRYLHSRLALLQVGGGKTRTIAMGDYWSQNILKGIHETIMNILKRLETDGTYNQDDQFERILSSANYESSSFDLSNATDRFPVELQEILLSHMFSGPIAYHWRMVLTARVFSYQGKTYKYKSGQPMGILSSWAAFSITHHCLIEYLHWKASGKLGFRNYSVLGDDVVIWDRRVASDYVTMLSSLSVKINYDKSLISDSQCRRIEFAKRIIFNGYEITGLKWDILKAASRSIYMTVQLIEVSQKRHWNLSWAEFKAPLSLSCKGKRLLSILIFAKGGIAPPMKGSRSFEPDELRFLLKKEVLTSRVRALKRKTDSIDKMERPSLVLPKLFDREGIVVSAQLIGLSQTLHPVIIGVNQASNRLLLAYTELFDILDEWEEGCEPPDTLPIEYLPVPSLRSYFGSRFDLKTIFVSQMVLDAWHSLERGKASTDQHVPGGNPGLDFMSG